MGSQEFFFVSGNYFINVNESYLPAEIALVKFTFETGIISKFHTYVNPGKFSFLFRLIHSLTRNGFVPAKTEKIPLGYQYDAKENSDSSHRLPIPPKAKGERNYQHIFDEIKKFLGKPTPIMFTARDNIPMIKSFIEQFVGDDESPDNGHFRVYPLHQVFFEIKEEAVRSSVNGVSFKSIHIAEQHLSRDDYAYFTNTACAVRLIKLFFCCFCL